MKTTLVLLRHAESTGNVTKKFCGQKNVHLTDHGKRQAEAVAKYLDRFNFDVIYSSDLKRTMQTVTPTAERQNKPIIKDKNLREIYCGKWEGLSGNTLCRIYPEEYAYKWFHDAMNVVTDGGESMQGFKKRVINAITEIAEKNLGKTVLVSTHGGPIRIMDCFAFHDCDWNDFPWATNASVYVCEYEDGKFTLLEGPIDHYLGDMVTKVIGKL